MVTSLVHLSAGSVFAGDFRVVRVLSEGGMGAVYVVEQMSTGKQRALKVMHPQLVHDEVIRQRFVQEARAGARIEKLVAEADVRDTAAIGSPLWMAPEQAEVGGQIQPSTDVWPLGLLAFFMLTGREFWRSANLETPSPMAVLTEMKIDHIPRA